MKRYYAYIRVSTVKQGERGSSLQEQRAAIETFAARHGLSIVEWFEERETAAKQGRHVFTRMLKGLERKHADGVIIHKIDRSARNLRDWANLGDLIDRGIDVQFAHDSVDLQSRGGRLSADIQAVVAADYIRNLREEVKKGFYGRLKQGIYPLPAPIGYLDRGKGQPKEIDPVRGPLIRQAFELYSTGTIGLKALQAEMKRRGLRNRNGKPVPFSGLSTAFNNPFYIGLIRLKRTKETFQGVHPPLVSKAVFDRVQAILRGKTVVRSVKHEFAFRRIVRCKGCERHLIGERQKGRIYYRCQSPTCKGTSIHESVLDTLVRDHLQLLICDDVEMTALRDLAETLNTNTVAEMGIAKNALSMRVAKCDERIARLTDAVIDGLIDKESFDARKSAVLDEKMTLLSELQELSVADLPANRAFKNLELGNMAYPGYISGIPPEQRRIIETVVSNLSIRGKKPEITLKSPFQEIAFWRKSLNGAPYRGTPRTRAIQLMDILLPLSKTTKSPSGSKPDTGYKVAA